MNSLQTQLLTDKQNIRLIYILNTLERSSTSSTKALANLLNVTPRTVISDISTIKNHFTDNVVINASNDGYSFKIKNKSAYTEQKRKLIENEPILVIISGIFFGEILSISDWAKKLFITVQTLDSYLKKLNPILKKYQLKLDYPVLTFHGDETNIRNFFLAVFYEEDSIPHYVFPSALVEDVIQQLPATAFEELHINVSYFKLSYLLFITYQRIISGHELSLSEYTVKSMLVAPFNKFIDTLHTSFLTVTSLDLTSADLVYLVLMMLDSSSLDIAPLDIEKNDSLLQPVINDFCKEFTISLDSHLVGYVQVFFQLYYLKHSASFTCLFTPPSLVQHINLYYKKELNMLKTFLKKHADDLKIDNASEFEYILLLFTFRLRYELNQDSYRIAFLIEGSPEYTKVTEDAAITYIPSRHKVYFFHAHKLTEKELTDLKINLVITNFSETVFELPENCKYLLFRYIPTAEDWNQLLQVIEPRIYKKFAINFK